MAHADKSVDLLILFRGGQKAGSEAPKEGVMGLYVVKVVTAEPAVTIVFEGSTAPIGSDIFEVPIRLQPLQEGSRYFALPITGNGHRWGLIEKLDGEEATGTFTSADGKTITVTNSYVEKIE